MNANALRLRATGASPDPPFRGAIGTLVFDQANHDLDGDMLYRPSACRARPARFSESG